MREVGAFEAKTKLSALLDAAMAGEEIIITRNGKEAARLVPPRSPKSMTGHAEIEAFLKELHKMRKGVRLGRGVTIKQLIEEGRK